MVTNSTISNNDAAEVDGGGWGGSIWSGGPMYISNSTVSDNYALVDGGGISNHGSLTTANTTFSNNGAVQVGGGIYNSTTGTITIRNTVLEAGTSGANIFNGGVITSLRYNMSSDDGGGVLTGPGDQIDTDALGPLQENGGPTFTHELLPGSPPIDAGDPTFIPPTFYDQRGPDFYRVRNGRVDIGSIEVQTGSTPAPTATPRATPTPRPRPSSLPR